MNKQSGIGHIVIIALVAVVLGVVGFAGWRVYYASQNASESAAQSTENVVTQPTAVEEVTAVEQEVDAINVDSELDSSVLDSDLGDLY